MTGQLAIVRRPSRRTHLTGDPIIALGTIRIGTLCGLNIPAADASGIHLDPAGGATSRLVRDLTRELGADTCKRCRRLADVILFCHLAREW